jgi:hypothetical protein
MTFGNVTADKHLQLDWREHFRVRCESLPPLRKKESHEIIDLDPIYGRPDPVYDHDLHDNSGFGQIDYTKDHESTHVDEMGAS